MARQNRNLILFFVATFLWTWACYLPIVLSRQSQLEMPWMILLICGGMGPSLVGVVLVLLTYTKAEQKEFWSRCFSVRRIHFRWWLVIFLLLPALYLTTIGVDLALGGSLPGMTQLRSLISNPAAWPLTVFLSFMSGPWSEEFGWRGFALRPLLMRMGVLKGTMLLGVAWGVWHLPLYFMSAGWHAQMGFGLVGFWTFIAYSIAISFVMTWIYLNTNESILSGMMVHFVMNFSAQLLFPHSDRVELLRVVPLLLVGVIGCLRAGRSFLVSEVAGISGNSTRKGELQE